MHDIEGLKPSPNTK
jgi:hypothetical protein